LRELEFNSFDVVVPSSSPAVPLVSSTQGIQPAFKPASPSTPKFANPLVPAIIPTTGPLRVPDSSLPTVASSVDLSTSQQPAVVKAGEDYYYYYYYYDEEEEGGSNPAAPGSEA